MKLPTLTRLARYKRFDYQPRYYDPVKENVQARVKSIQKRMEQENTGVYQQNDTRIREAFQQNRRKSKQIDLMQIAFILLFGGTIYAYLEYGNPVIIPAFSLFVGYVWLRIKKG